LTFAVNERDCESYASETVLLSAMIYHLIGTHVRTQAFVIDDDLIMTDVFSTIVNSIRSFRVEVLINALGPRSCKSSLFIISRKVCNLRLELFFLSIVDLIEIGSRL
jgi:hypothetical protein